MTDLLSPLSARFSAPSGERARPPLVIGAALAGIAAPLLGLLVTWVLGLAAWYSADGGSHGSTTSVLRLGADAWLLAHGAHLDLRTTLGPVTVTASPLGLTLVCAWLTFRTARWAARSCVQEGLRGVGLSAAALASCYAAVSLAAALLAGTPRVAPGPGLAFLGGLGLAAFFGGLGLVAGAGRAGELRRRIPVPALSGVYAGTAATILLCTAGALLSAVSLTAHGPGAVRVADRLGLDVAGGLFSVVLLALVAPNVSMLGASYLLGPGFALGTGTVVSPAEVSLGPVPALPVLAAVPGNGPAPGWTTALVAVPVLCGLVAALLAGRALPTSSYRSGALRGLLGGLLGGVLVAGAVAWSGGAVGPGRMTVLGAETGAVLPAALGALTVSGLLGGLGASWWARRHGLTDAAHPARERAPHGVTLYGTPPVLRPVVPVARRPRTHEPADAEDHEVTEALVISPSDDHGLAPRTGEGAADAEG